MGDYHNASICLKAQICRGQISDLAKFLKCFTVFLFRTKLSQILIFLKLAKEIIISRHPVIIILTIILANHDPISKTDNLKKFGYFGDKISAK